MVKENKIVALYHNGRKLHRVWQKTLTDLPSKLFVTDDGQRVAIVDRYYGNDSLSSVPVVSFLNENGEQIASYLLGDVANLKRVIKTISSAQWYENAHFSPDKQNLLIETIVSRSDRKLCETVTSNEQAENCLKSIPFQELRFSLATGELVERKQLASK